MNNKRWPLNEMFETTKSMDSFRAKQEYVGGIFFDPLYTNIIHAFASHSLVINKLLNPQPYY